MMDNSTKTLNCDSQLFLVANLIIFSIRQSMSFNIILNIKVDHKII